MFRFTIRDVLWLTVVAGLGVGWWMATRRTMHELRETKSALQAKADQLHSENSRLAKGPDWAAMDRIMDQYALHWLQLQKREQELGLEPTPSPYNSPPEPGDAVPKVPPTIFPADTRASDGP